MELQTFPPTDQLRAIHHSGSGGSRLDEGGEKSNPELEATESRSSRPASVDLPSRAQCSGDPRRNALWERVQFFALCWTMFLSGWSDGTLGPLLSRIRIVYDIGFAILSLLFVFSSLGFITGGMANVYLSDKWGFGTILFIGSILQIIGFALTAPALPFPGLVFSLALNSLGIAVQNAQGTGYIAAMKDKAEEKMGVLQASYGVGALCSPLVATQFAQAKHWSFHYLVSLGIAVVNAAILLFVFRLKTQDECLLDIGQPIEPKGTSDKSKFRQILGIKTVHLLAVFILIYVGIEVTIGGWIATYLVAVRGGGPSSGYVSSGFFGGLAIGRVALLWVNKLVGPRKALYIYAVLAIGFEFVVWFVPSLIGNAVAVSIVGLMMGPMYPLAMTHAGKVLPRWVLTSSIGYIASFGQAGSAVVPLMTAALASKFGIKSLQPLVVAMMGLLISVWWVVPTRVLTSD